MQRGTHFPLCIKLGGVCRRSSLKQKERTRGSWEYKEKQLRKSTAGDTNHSQNNTWQASHVRMQKGKFGIGPKQRPPPNALPDGSQDLSRCTCCGAPPECCMKNTWTAMHSPKPRIRRADHASSSAQAGIHYQPGDSWSAGTYHSGDSWWSPAPADTYHSGDSWWSSAPAGTHKWDARPWSNNY